MPRNDRVDAAGAVALVLFSAFLGFNQVVIRVVNDGLQPVFFAGLRSAGAVVCVAAWMAWRGQSFRPAPGTIPWGLAIGAVFSVEFVLLFTALDLTTVVRTSVIFYSMPVWMALGAHLWLPGERLGRARAAGLALAFAGTAVAILGRGPGAGGSLAGDLCALGAAFGWAAVGLLARASPLRRATPAMQVLWQNGVTGALLIALAPAFGPLIRDFQPIHLWGLAFQIVLVASAGFVFWLWLLTVYPAASVAAFSFLGPIFGLMFGWALLDEAVGPGILVSLALVAAGLWLMNRPGGAAAGPQVPQKV